MKFFIGFLMSAVASSSFASSAREVPCGTVDGIQYTVKQLETQASAIVTGYDGDSKFIVTVSYQYALGSRSNAIDKFGHRIVYQPFVFDRNTNDTQPALLFVDGTELQCE